MLSFTEHIFIQCDHALGPLVTRDAELPSPSTGGRHKREGRGLGGVCAGTDGPHVPGEPRMRGRREINVLDV